MKRTRQALPERLPEWGVSVFESHHAPGFQMDWRRHRFLKVIYVLAGAGCLELENSEIPFKSGDLLVVPAGVPNRIADTPTAPSSLYVLCVARSLLCFDSEAEKSLTPGRQPRSAYLANRAESQLKRLLYQQAHGGETTRLTMVASMLELLAMLIRPGSSEKRDEGNVTLSEMERYIDELDRRFFEATTIDDAAAQLGMSRRRFTELFREVTGKAWLAYVHERAIGHATRLLAETSVPITSVAFECGFRDLSTFYRRFKALKDCSPAEWRRRNKPLSHGL